MKRTFSLLAASFSLAGFSAAAKVYYPVPGLVNESTGLLESFVAGDWYRGSGVVARDSRLIYSCAHLFYESREWATDYNFYRANHSATYPDESTAASPRGLHYFTSYSSGVKSYGSDSNQAFASDFTVLYANSSFGTAVNWWPMGGLALRSANPKLIVGYPSDIDFTGASGHCYQHSTGWFDYEAFRLYGIYHEFDDVSTGSGNSGGPIFVRNTATGDDLLAGILVAGTRRTAGIVVLDLSTDTLAGYALGLKDKILTFTETAARKLPDGTRTYTTIPIRVSGFSGSISKLKLSLSIATKRRGDLDVYLKSPNGRIRWISKRAGGSTDNLEIHDLNLSKFFTGYAPNGTWELKMRDSAAGTRATFLSGSLTVSAL
jgi:hypothetical protein